MSRRSRSRILLAAVAIAIAVVAFLNYFVPGDPWRIETERTSRRVTSALGRPLPGTPQLGKLDDRLASQGFALGAAVMIRIFKAEFELELWLLKAGRFERFATYPICRWSGGLGPKLEEGDRQAPEGFYSVDAAAMNPKSRWHRSFNIGFPNAFDRAHGRTGTFLMVHGGCSSIGCYAMTDPVIDEIWRLMTNAFAAKQQRVAVHIFPFRLTDANLARTVEHSWHAFWSELRIGHDLFERDRLPPRVGVCQGRYHFEPAFTIRDAGVAIEPQCQPRQQPRSL